jgi:TRAP-type C4-dicarboxylate transport system substrate-binding protein
MNVRGTAAHARKACTQRRALVSLSLVALVLAACGSTSTSSSGSSAASEKTYVVKAAVAGSAGSVLGTYMTAFANKVQADSGGHLKIDIFLNSVLGTNSQEFDALRAGTIQLADENFTVADNLFPDLDLLTLPGFWQTSDVWMAANNGGKLQTYFNSELETKGIITAGDAYSGNFGFVTNKPISGLSSLPGLKMATLPGPYIALAMKDLGIEGVPLSGSQFVTSEQTGLINSLAYAPTSTLQNGDYPFFKYVYQMPGIFIPALAGFMMNYAWYKTLPSNLQKILTNDAVSVSTAFEATQIGETATAVTTLQQKGLTVTTISQTLFDSIVSTFEQPVVSLFAQNNGSTALNIAKATPGFSSGS